MKENNEENAPVQAKVRTNAGSVGTGITTCKTFNKRKQQMMSGDSNT